MSISGLVFLCCRNIENIPTEVREDFVIQCAICVLKQLAWHIFSCQMLRLYPKATDRPKVLMTFFFFLNKDCCLFLRAFYFSECTHDSYTVHNHAVNT